MAEKKDDITLKKERVIARAASQKPHEYPVEPASLTGGVMPMSIVGRFRSERARLGPDFTEAERQWRITWHNDQHLHPSEPLPEHPAVNKEKYWWLRRIYRTPGDYIEKHILEPRFGHGTANGMRRFFGKLPLFYIAALWAWYQVKYHGSNWEVMRQSSAYISKVPKYPGDEGFGQVEVHDKWDWVNHGFDGRRAFRNVQDPNRWII